MSLERILIVPDVHAPYHDQRAWDVMLKAAKALKPQTIICLGDLADVYSLSSFSKDPNRVSDLDAELIQVRELREELDGLDASTKHFIEGNHEDRLRRYLQEKAPELFSLIDTDTLLELGDNGWTFTPYKESLRYGSVYYTHDIGGAGKYTTARALETFQHSVVIGHHHAQDYYVRGNAVGEYHVGAQFGWLGDVGQVDYIHQVKAKRTWSLGFGVGYRDTETDLSYLQPVPIVEYTCCVNGKVYSA